MNKETIDGYVHQQMAAHIDRLERAIVRVEDECRIAEDFSASSAAIVYPTVRTADIRNAIKGRPGD